MDVTLDITSKKIAILGYGSQGHAHALNLKDSGAANLVVGLREGSANKAMAEKAGLTVQTIEDAAATADVVMMLIPDETQPEVYRSTLQDTMKPGAALGFAHGFCIHYKLIELREDLDVFMVAPKGPGKMLRAQYIQGSGLPSLIATHQDRSGETLALAKSYATAIGSTPEMILETTFKDECETDLFGEQAVLCGGLVELMRNGFETLTEAGYPPEIAYFETIHEVKLIVDLVHANGIEAMQRAISNTAEYGGYVTGPTVLNEDVKQRMQEVLGRIQSGEFAKAFMNECTNGQPTLVKHRQAWGQHPIETVGKRLRQIIFGPKEKERVKENKKAA